MLLLPVRWQRVNYCCRAPPRLHRNGRRGPAKTEGCKSLRVVSGQRDGTDQETKSCQETVSCTKEMNALMPFVPVYVTTRMLQDY